jgi:type I restriction enzyme M protein
MGYTEEQKPITKLEKKLWTSANKLLPALEELENLDKSQKGKTLFIDAREMGEMINRRQRRLTETFHRFRIADLSEIAKHDYILTPGRYVGVAEEEDDGIPFAEKMAELTAKLGEQFAESHHLEKEIRKNLSVLGWKI